MKGIYSRVITKYNRDYGNGINTLKQVKRSLIIQVFKTHNTKPSRLKKSFTPELKLRHAISKKLIRNSGLIRQINDLRSNYKTCYPPTARLSWLTQECDYSIRKDNPKIYHNV